MTVILIIHRDKYYMMYLTVLLVIVINISKDIKYQAFETAD